MKEANEGNDVQKETTAALIIYDRQGKDFLSAQNVMFFNFGLTLKRCVRHFKVVSV